MTYSQFLRDLFAEGRVTAPEMAPLSAEELLAGDAIIAEYEQIHRLDLPGIAPSFVSAAGRWAATRLFRACQFAVYRDLDEVTMRNELDVRYENELNAGVHYSVDLVFRYLPDLARFAGSAAERDPLLSILNRWAEEWPLSSVGMSGVGDVSIDGFAKNTGLMQLYADRIIENEETSRLSCAVTRDVVQRSLGMFPDLAPRLTIAITKMLEQTADSDESDKQEATT